MSIMDTKPFMPPRILYNIFANRQSVTGNRILLGGAGDLDTYGQSPWHFIDQVKLNLNSVPTAN
jgi:hypothetical protein